MASPGYTLGLHMLWLFLIKFKQSNKYFISWYKNIFADFKEPSKSYSLNINKKLTPPNLVLLDFLTHEETCHFTLISHSI